MIIFSYISYFFLATISPLQRRWLSTRNEGGNKIDLSFKVSLVSSILALFIPIFSPLKISSSTTEIILLALLSGLGGLGFNLLYFSSQRHVEAGTTSVLGNIYTPITIVLSTLLLGEGLRGLQILGAILLIVATIIVSKKHKVGKLKYDKYFWMMILSSVPLSVLLVSQRQLMKVTGFTASIIIGWWAITICLGLLSLFYKTKTTYKSKDILITGSLKFLQDMSWGLLTFFVANLSLVSTISTFKVVLIFITAAIFLKERDNMGRKIIGSLIAVAGLLLMK